jgi:hypothetical protein
MSWIQVDISLINNNPKVLALASDLGISEVETLGILVKLWAYSFEYGKKAGHIPYSEQVPVICWGGKDYFPELIKGGFVDKKKSGLFVHDWEDKYSALDRYRKMNSERQRKHREKQKEAKTKETKESLKQQGIDLDNLIGDKGIDK